MTQDDRHTPDFVQWAAGQTEPALPDLDLAPNPELVAQGWVRRFMAGPDRIQEAIELYEELGFEVAVDEIDPSELSEVCGDCRLATCFAYKTIYVRKPRAED